MEDIEKFSDFLDKEAKKEREEENFNSSEWEIDSIISIMDEDPAKSEQERLETDEVSEAITFDATVPKDVKRGDHIWITALIKRKGATSMNDSGRQAVIKLRVVDIYYGLQHLNKIINR